MLFHFDSSQVFDQVAKSWQSGIPLKYTVTVTLVVIANGQKITRSDISEGAPGHDTVLYSGGLTCRVRHIVTNRMKDQHSSQVHFLQ